MTKPLADRINFWARAGLRGDLTEWRRAFTPIPTEAESIRQLTDAALHVFSPSMIRRLEEWAETQEDRPEWPEAARRLLVEAVRPKD